MKTIEMYILLFFVYAFAGWIMESIGGILKVKKFVNRGFLIGPYCPVYGFGVVFVELLLHKYINDLPALIILSILICGTLEYMTSYYMEKLFHARWWNYHNRKFNINGRICLETLIPFGFAATIIIKFINPFLMNRFLLIPNVVINIVTGILTLGIFVDFIISFYIISSFKGEIYKEKDNTEEIGNMVKDKAEDVLMQATSDAIVFTRKLKVKELKFERKMRYTRKQFTDKMLETPRELAEKINQNRELINKKRQENREKRIQKFEEEKLKFDLKRKESKEKFENKMKEIKNTSDEFSKEIIERFKNKSLLKRRLMNAFPELKIKEKKNNKSR